MKYIYLIFPWCKDLLIRYNGSTSEAIFNKKQDIWQNCSLGILTQEQLNFKVTESEARKKFPLIFKRDKYESVEANWQ